MTRDLLHDELEQLWRAWIDHRLRDSRRARPSGWATDRAPDQPTRSRGRGVRRRSRAPARDRHSAGRRGGRGGWSASARRSVAMRPTENHSSRAGGSMPSIGLSPLTPAWRVAPGAACGPSSPPSASRSSPGSSSSGQAGSRNMRCLGHGRSSAPWPRRSAKPASRTPSSSRSGEASSALCWRSSSGSCWPSP
jgi:hypothetical protein